MNFFPGQIVYSKASGERCKVVKETETHLHYTCPNDGAQYREIEYRAPKDIFSGRKTSAPKKKRKNLAL